MKQFSAENKNCFSYGDVLEEYPDKDRSFLSKVLAAMVNAGMLMKLYRDLCCIIPLSADPDTYSPDSRLVAKCIMKGKEYYLAYYSAIYSTICKFKLSIKNNGIISSSHFVRSVNSSVLLNI